jgi:organic radical activating enzyme
MKFPWNKYIEIPTERRNTLQIFITNRCNLRCNGCFARKIMKNSNEDISIQEYISVIKNFINKGGQQVNLLGGEPLLHPKLREILRINKENHLKTTIYTNGKSFDGYLPFEELKDVKLRVSIYSYNKEDKSCLDIVDRGFKFDANFMVSSKTTVSDLILSAIRCELIYNCNVFFISSLRELDNDRREFFDDTPLTMPILQYKELVHRFLDEYEGNMDIHVSKRGVFESTLGCGYNKCRFSNYFIGGKIIQCPYDIVNLKYQDDYNFDNRYCQHNNTCMMTKVIFRKANK